MNKIIISVTNRGGKEWWLDITLEKRKLSLLNGEKEELKGIYDRICGVLKSIDTLEDGYNLEIRPYDKEHLLEGWMHNFTIKEKNESAKSDS